VRIKRYDGWNQKPVKYGGAAKYYGRKQGFGNR
jgi:hypothetical protein